MRGGGGRAAPSRARGADATTTRPPSPLAALFSFRAHPRTLLPYFSHAQSRRLASTAATPDQAASATPGGGSPVPPFHLAIPVADINAARDFYGGKLGCPEGRSADTWVDFSLHGHQLVCHEVKGYDARSSASAVDGDPVPVPHFGLALTAEAFHALAARVAAAGIVCELGPRLRFKGAPGEQMTMFFRDPSGNALEFKAMSKPENLFARYKV
jgi:extradiol dioxygenase family protein